MSGRSGGGSKREKQQISPPAALKKDWRVRECSSVSLVPALTPDQHCLAGSSLLSRRRARATRPFIGSPRKRSGPVTVGGAREGIYSPDRIAHAFSGPACLTVRRGGRSGILTASCGIDVLCLVLGFCCGFVSFWCGLKSCGFFGAWVTFDAKFHFVLRKGY